MERIGGSGSDAAALRQLTAAIDDIVIDQIASSMVDAMSSGVPEAGADPDIHADALSASRETARGFLAGLGSDPWVVEGTPPGLADLARTLARRGLDITVLMKLVRYGQAVFWPAIMDTAERAVDNPSARMRLLAVVFERFGNYVETLLDDTVTVFQLERDQRMRGTHARRQEVIESLIAGEAPSIDGASRVLGYELRRSHTALALWDSRGSHEALDRLEALAQEIASALGARRALSTPSGSRGIWAWIPTDGPPTVPQRSAVGALRAHAGLRAAIGQPGTGMSGFRRSHEEALAAQRIALTDGRDELVTWYSDVEIVSLLSYDARGARALVARELAGLTGLDGQSEKLRRTTLAYVRCGCSATAAGRELGVHTNTVRYRIERAQEALGRPLQGQELRLQLGLMLVESAGSSLLPDASD
jgi:DNA-binding PucR family transcriptional regulator